MANAITDYASSIDKLIKERRLLHEISAPDDSQWLSYLVVSGFIFVAKFKFFYFFSRVNTHRLINYTDSKAFVGFSQKLTWRKIFRH